MSIRAGVVVAVTFQQVDDTPDAETSAQSDNEGLKHFDRAIEEFHGDFLLKIKSLRPAGYTPEIVIFISCQPQRELIYWCILGPGVNKNALPEQGERNDYLRPVYSQRASSFSQSMVPLGRTLSRYSEGISSEFLPQKLAVLTSSNIKRFILSSKVSFAVRLK